MFSLKTKHTFLSLCIGVFASSVPPPPHPPLSPHLLPCDGHANIFRRVRSLRNATVSFVMSVCPSVRMEQLGSHWTDFN